MATHTIGGLDFEVLRRAIEGPDAETLVGLYAEVITVNRSTTPGSPQILRGKEQIGGRLRDVCGREITDRVEDEVLGEGRVAFQEAREYPDGVRVLGAETLEVRDGKIVRQVNVEAWDEWDETWPRAFIAANDMPGIRPPSSRKCGPRGARSGRVWPATVNQSSPSGSRTILRPRCPGGQCRHDLSPVSVERLVHRVVH